jgi:hypothetical protein
LRWARSGHRRMQSPRLENRMTSVFIALRGEPALDKVSAPIPQSLRYV